MSQDQPKLLAKKKSRRTTLEAIPRGWNQRRTIEVEARPHWVTFLPRWVLYLFGHPVTPKKKRFLNPQLFCKKKSQKEKTGCFRLETFWRLRFFRQYSYNHVGSIYGHNTTFIFRFGKTCRGQWRQLWPTPGGFFFIRRRVGFSRQTSTLVQPRTQHFFWQVTSSDAALAITFPV